MASVVAGAERHDAYSLNFEQTELRLGLPGAEGDAVKSGGGHGKRSFSQTVDLKLNLSSEDMEKGGMGKMEPKTALPAKAQVVGWPPVKSFRKNTLSVQKNSSGDGKPASSNTSRGAAFIKVSMDGAPFLRKVDLRMYKSYQELSDSLGKLFSSFTIGNEEPNGSKDAMNESKLVDLLSGCEYVLTYEDKDGDWMLVGDVPWGMFVNSCKRMRIMKGTEAIGLAPRAIEKCKNKI